MLGDDDEMGSLLVSLTSSIAFLALISSGCTDDKVMDEYKDEVSVVGRGMSSSSLVATR